MLALDLGKYPVIIHFWDNNYVNRLLTSYKIFICNIKSLNLPLYNLKYLLTKKFKTFFRIFPKENRYNKIHGRPDLHSLYYI